MARPHRRYCRAWSTTEHAGYYLNYVRPEHRWAKFLPTPLDRQLVVLLLGQGEKQTADVFDLARDSFDERLASGVAAQQLGALFKSEEIDMNSEPESRFSFSVKFSSTKLYRRKGTGLMLEPENAYKGKSSVTLKYQ